MTKLNPSEMLSEQIAILERQRDTDLLALKYQLHETGQSLKPANIIKSAVQDVAGNDQVKSIFKKAMIGLVVGLVAKAVLSRKKKRKPINLTRTVLSIGLNMLISNRYRLLKSAGAMAASALFTHFMNKYRLSSASNMDQSSSPDEQDIAYTPS